MTHAQPSGLQGRTSVASLAIPIATTAANIRAYAWAKYNISDLQDMRAMKHFAETIGLGTIGKLDDEDGAADSRRLAMRNASILQRVGGTLRSEGITGCRAVDGSSE